MATSIRFDADDEEFYGDMAKVQEWICLENNSPRLLKILKTRC
jgi:hypothetical protein